MIDAERVRVSAKIECAVVAATSVLLDALNREVMDANRPSSRNRERPKHRRFAANLRHVVLDDGHAFALTFNVHGFRELDVNVPSESSGWQRDRVAVLSQRVVDVLNIC